MVKRVVLLVDDDLREIELIREAVLSAGVSASEFRASSTIEDAVGYLAAFESQSYPASHIPRLVLLDLKLAQGTAGLDLLRVVRHIPRVRHIPIVMLTSSREASDVSSSYAASANAFLVKPTDHKELRETMRQAVHFWLGLNQLPPPSLSPSDPSKWPSRQIE